MIKEQSWPKKIIQWFDAYAADEALLAEKPDRIELVRVIPFIGLHLGCLGVIWVGWSPVAVAAAILLYLARMFAITGFYHRYFSHRAYKANRLVQFLMAVAGCTACQRGPLWWASHHRHHHRVADTPDDPHSPVIHGFLHSHTLWFLQNCNFMTRHQSVKDWRQYPELVMLDRFDSLIPVVFGFCLLGAGHLLGNAWPSLGTSGMQMLVWGLFISTVAVYHATYTINSLSHLIGSRRFETPDHSRNNLFLAIITLGEGWHNNHHHYAVSARQGFARNELDITWMILRMMKKMRLIRDLRPVPASVYQEVNTS